MDSVGSWIAPLTESLISSYLGETANPKLNVDVNESNIRFTHNPERWAVIANVR